MSNYRDIKTDEVRELPRDERWPGGRDNTANILNEPRELSGPLSEDEAKRDISRRSRRNFLVGGAAALLGIFGWRWMPDETKYKLLRGTFEFNEWVSQNLYSTKRLAPEFSPDRVGNIRVNGMEGMSEGFNPSAWKLTIAGLTSTELTLTMDDIKSLPRTEMTPEFKCIEGWSVVLHWAGVRVSDLVARYGDASKLPRYVSLITPDEGYFVGWDTESIMHPQTLLAYELNGQPLTSEHGAPLRIASPLKYGIKQIKRVGRIEFTNERPKDYWGEQGYDWYSGH
ncbi:MAG: molybdopterin-dependent oxidoreductase [Pyrinomonadaceae bacterium]